MPVKQWGNGEKCEIPESYELPLGAPTVSLGFDAVHGRSVITFTWKTEGKPQKGIFYEGSLTQTYVAGKGLQDMWYDECILRRK